MADKYNDDDLLRDFNRGSQSAFQEIFLRYHDKIYFTCFRITRNIQEAQDISLVTLQKLFEKCSDFNSLAHIGYFVYTTARNRSLNYVRDLKVLNERQQQLIRSISPLEDALKAELDAEYLHLIIKGMEKLPERARLVLKLRYMEDLKNQEIADMLGISVHTVKNHLTLAIRKLRESLQTRTATELVVMVVLALFFYW